MNITNWEEDFTFHSQENEKDFIAADDRSAFLQTTDVKSVHAALCAQMMRQDSQIADFTDARFQPLDLAQADRITHHIRVRPQE